MPILQHCENPETSTKSVRWIRNIKGHEADRILHYGSCPLTGQIQHGGAKGPSCSELCVGPTPPVAIEISHRNRVLNVIRHISMPDGSSRDVAQVWDYRRRITEYIVLNNNPVFPTMAIVDADDFVKTKYNNWIFGYELAISIRKERDEKARQKEAEQDLLAIANSQEGDIANIVTSCASTPFVSFQQQLASRIRKGAKVIVISDVASSIVQHRKNSLVSCEGVCLENPQNGYVFVRIENQGMKKLHKSQIRVLLSNGSLGEEDTF